MWAQEANINLPNTYHRYHSRENESIAVEKVSLSVPGPLAYEPESKFALKARPTR